MKIKLPKDLRGFSYDRVMPVDLNSFDVDLLLPSIFFKAITGGQSWGRRPNDPTKIREYSDELAAHEDIVGFDDDQGRRLLNRLTRTSLVQIGRKGTSRAVEQIEGVTPYTLLAFKPEFPSEHSRLRRVDTLVFRMMREQLRDDIALRRFFEDIFGKGLTIRAGAEPDGCYDGRTELDTLARLSIALIDGFESTSVRKAKERLPREPCPAVASSMARDLRRYLEAYRDRMPIEALTHHLKALINAELFVYSLKLFYAVTHLVERPIELPPAMRRQPEPSPPEIYLDFTGAPSGPSRQMAAGCVRRDLEAIQRFIQANLTLRQLDRYVHRIRGDHRVRAAVAEALADDEGGPEYLQALLGLLEDTAVVLRIDAAAQNDEDAIRRENSDSGAEGDEAEGGQTILDFVVEAAESDFERLVLLLTEGQRTQTAKNIISWYWSVGGLTKPYGILSGTLKSRQSWRYAPGNDLLATLVLLAAVDIPKWDKSDPSPHSIHLSDFLDWLERRFGILVDRPPAGYVGSDYVAAAQENLRAMLRRLQQMGVFRDLSDDFTVQRLTPPYAAGEVEWVPS
jgi:hypothetical protein